jgi:hypothetical protein
MKPEKNDGQTHPILFNGRTNDMLSSRRVLSLVTILMQLMKGIGEKHRATDSERHAIDGAAFSSGSPTDHPRATHLTTGGTNEKNEPRWVLHDYVKNNYCDEKCVYYRQVVRSAIDNSGANSRMNSDVRVVINGCRPGSQWQLLI